MSFPDLRQSIDLVKSRLESLPSDGKAVDACGPELSALGTRVTAAIEAEFLVLTEPSAA